VYLQLMGNPQNVNFSGPVRNAKAFIATNNTLYFVNSIEMHSYSHFAARLVHRNMKCV